MLRKCFDSNISNERKKQSLLRYVLENDTYAIETLINNNNKHLLLEPYENKGYLQILHIACLNVEGNIQPYTIETLIKCGADVDYKSYTGFTPLHCAAQGLNSDNFLLLLDHIKDINVTNDEGKTTLSSLIENVNYFKNKSKFEECINILLNKNINVNILDIYNKSAIFYAAYYQIKSVVQLLLNVKDIDIDTYVENKECTARSLIATLGISTKHIPNKKFDHLDDIGILKHYLRAGNEDGFINLASRMASLDDKDGQESLIQIACQCNLLSIVKYLVKRDVDINSVTDKCNKKPIELAIIFGSVEVLNFLLCEVPMLDRIIIFENVCGWSYYKNPGYLKCIEIILENNSFYLDLNRNDYFWHPLSYFGYNSNISRLLLKNGVSLANKNLFGLTISQVKYEFIKEHFDDCIEETKYPDGSCKFLSYNYTTLFPSDEEYLLSESVYHKGQKAEMEAVFYMSKSNQLRDLLKHPLITIFLYLKWYQAQSIFYGNLLFYIVYCVILLVHIGTSHNKEFGFTFIFLLITTIILLIKELLQICMLPRSYFINFENYVEIALVSTVLSVLFSDYSIAKTKQIYAVIILLAALELLFLLGNMPSLSVYILMLRVVSLNFFKFLLFYSILIFAFSLSFYMLLNDTNNITIFETQPDDCESTNFFANYGSSIFKTIIMLSGELDASNIRFDKFSITSHLIFVVFVITMPIILLNLLNGLAISDTQNIRNEAELYVLIARVEYLMYIESMIFGNTGIFSYFPPLTWMQKALFKMSSVRINLLNSELSFKIKAKKGKFVMKTKKICNYEYKILFDNDILKETKLLLREKEEKQNATSADSQDKLIEIGTRLDLCDRQLLDLQSKLKEMVNRMDIQDKRLIEIQETQGQILNILEIFKNT